VEPDVVIAQIETSASCPVSVGSVATEPSSSKSIASELIVIDVLQVRLKNRFDPNVALTVPR
jgi:hypothetical protein